MKFTAEFEGGQAVTMDVPTELESEQDYDVLATELMPVIIRENPGFELLELLNCYVWEN